MSMSSGFICSQPTSQDHDFAELEAMLATQNQAERMPPPNYNPTLTGRMIPTPNDKKLEGKSRKKKLVFPPRHKRHNFYDDKIEELLDFI